MENIYVFPNRATELLGVTHQRNLNNGKCYLTTSYYNECVPTYDIIINEDETNDINAQLIINGSVTW